MSESQQTVAVDLRRFCAKDLGPLPINKPWVKDKRRIATDGRICVAVPTDEPDHDPSLRYPRLTGFFDLNGIGWTVLPSVKSRCDLCNGAGFFLEPYYCHGGCDATGLWHKVICGCHIRFGTRKIATHYAQLIAELPGIEWGAKDSDSGAPIHFRFDGGCGLLMPLDPSCPMPSPGQPDWPREFITPARSVSGKQPIATAETASR